MTRIEYQLELRLDAATSPAEAVWSILEQAVGRAEKRARANSPSGGSGGLRGGHYIKLDKKNSVVYLGNSAPYAEYVLPKGWRGRWRWFMRRCLRDAADEVAKERSQELANSVLGALGPKTRGKVSTSPLDTGGSRSGGGGRTLSAYARSKGR